jgi:uncharacterized LabA/DUF88 family protein
MIPKPERAALFVDGSNWYHGCVKLGLARIGRLSFPKVSQKLVGFRHWVATKYYVGEVPRIRNLLLAEHQRRFLEHLKSSDPRISVHLGRIEPRRAVNQAADELRRYLGQLEMRIDDRVRRDLMRIVAKHGTSEVMVEKAVDVQIALDMVFMAQREDYDAAFLLSADGDLTPAVEAVRRTGRKVFIASPLRASKLAGASNGFLRLDAQWFDGMFDD